MRARWVSVGVLWTALSLTAGVGCSGDFGDDVPVDTGEDETGLGSTGLPDAATSGDPGPLDSTGEDGTGGQESDECDADCGEGGYCDFDDDGSPVCVCDEGYAAYGLRCLVCSPSSGDLEIDIPRVEVSASFLLNGQPFPASPYEHATILLRDPSTGDEVELGDTADGGTSQPVVALPGTYEVHYAGRSGGDQVPTNRSAKIFTVTIPDQDAYDFEIDVPAVALSGAFTMNGAEPPEGQFENGTVVLRNLVTGDEVELGDTRDRTYDAIVIPGLYQVHYGRRLADAEAPINQDARLGEVEITDVGDDVLDVDIPVAMLSGEFTLDGDTPPNGNFENGRILLRDLVTGDEIVLGQTRDGSYAAPVVPGEYEVVYQRVFGGAQVPVNAGAVLRSTTLDAGDQALDIDIATAVITGDITIAGAPSPSDPTNDGVLFLRNDQTGDRAVLGNTAAGTYSSRVVLGEYDVYYRQETSSGGVPVNTHARLESIAVRGGATFDIDVPMVTVSATVTVDGQIPPESAYDDGLLYLRDAQTGDSVLLGNTRLATLQRPVIPGTYDLHYVVEAAGPTMPVNARSRLDTVDVGPGTDIDIDIPVVDLHGVITLDGAPPPMGNFDRAALLMHDVSTDDVIYLGAIDNGEVRQSLTAGTYVLAYQKLITNGVVPANQDSGLACIELTAP